MPESESMMTDDQSEKGDTEQLRRALRAKRRALAVENAEQHAEAVAQKCLQIEALTSAQTIGSYLPMAGELDPGPTAAMLAAAVFVPVIGEDFTMEFRMFATAGGLGDAAGQPLLKNKYGILEPPAGGQSIDAADLDAVLVPLVAFDHNGHRVGMGGGYYDRAFGFRIGAVGKRPVLVGVAHGLQQVDAIDVQHWDVPLDYVVTEREILGPFPSWSGFVS